MAHSSGIQWEQSSATVKVGETVTVPVIYGEVPTWDISRDLNNLATAVVNGQSVVFTGIKAGTVTITKDNLYYLNDFTLTVEANDTQVIVAEQSLQDIADSIRTKLGTSDTYLPSEMSEAIDSIQTKELVISEPFGILLDKNRWSNNTYMSSSDISTSTIFSIGKYNAGSNGLQIGLPTNSSSHNSVLAAEAVLSILNYSNSASNVTITIHADNIPLDDINVVIYGLEPIE